MFSFFNRHALTKLCRIHILPAYPSFKFVCRNRRHRYSVKDSTFFVPATRSIHDGLRASSWTFVCPASARASPTECLLSAAESRSYINNIPPNYQSKPADARPSSITRATFARQPILSTAAVRINESPRHDLRPIPRWSAAESAASDCHGHSGSHRSNRLLQHATADIHARNAKRFSTLAGLRRQERTSTAIASANAASHERVAIASTAEPSHVARAHGSPCE